MSMLPRIGHYLKINPKYLINFPVILNESRHNSIHLATYPAETHFCTTLTLQNALPQIQKRCYAKGKDKKGKDKKSSTIHISDADMAEVIDVDGMKEEFNSVLQKMMEDFAKNLSLRTSLGALESIPVQFEGDTYPLAEISQVIRKNPQMVVINSTAFPQAIVDIKTALNNSGMNLNPQQEGVTLYVPIPKVTKEYREGLAKNAKTLSEKYKTQIRNIHSKYSKMADSSEGKVSEDTIRLAKLKVKEIMAQHQKHVDEALKLKEKELLQISS